MKTCEICGPDTPEYKNGRCLICRYLLRLGMPDGYLCSNKTKFSESMQRYFDTTDSLYINGVIGTGKTWLMAAIMRETLSKTETRDEQGDGFVDYSTDILFASLPEIVVALKDSMNPNSSMTEKQILDQYSKIKVLFLDDVGADYTTEYVRSFLFLLMERRSTGRGLRTVITSNLSLNELAKIHGERIASRITGMCKVVKLSGKDRRNEKV